MNNQRMVDELIRDEGVSLKPYRCTAGKLTIGIGRNLDDRGITEREALHLLQNDIDRAWWDLNDIVGDLAGMPEEAQMVLVNMRFQLGGAGLRSFKRMLRAVRSHQWKEAAAELRDSKLWRKDSPARAERLAVRLEALGD